MTGIWFIASQQQSGNTDEIFHKWTNLNTGQEHGKEELDSKKLVITPTNS
jgi:hypothetical protein